MLLVVTGPRTRLARALLATPWVQRQETMLLARDQRERAAIAAAYPQAVNLDASMLAGAALPTRHQAVAIACCALGPIHPGDADLERHVDPGRRDIRAVELIAAAYPNAALHVLFVSSVLALTARGGRRCYGGWKTLLEGTLERIQVRHACARVSVLYPGRLVEHKHPLRPVTLLHTSYAGLARKMVRVLRSARARRAIVGTDARLVLAIHALRAGRAAVLGSW